MRVTTILGFIGDHTRFSAHVSVRVPHLVVEVC